MKIALVLSQIASPQQMCLAAALRLRDAGHAIHVFVPESGRDLLGHSDLSHSFIADPAITAFNALLPKPRGRRSLASRRARAGQAIAQFGVDAFGDELRELGPDLVLVDAELAAHAIMAVGAGYPTALLASMYQSPPGLQAPPLHYRQSPGVVLRGSKAAVGLAWGYYLVRKHAVHLRNALRDWGADHPSALAALERREGTRIGRHHWVWQMPFNLRLPMLLMVPGALDLPANLREDQAFVGPLILKHRPPQSFDPAALKRFSSGRVRVLLAFGTMLRTQEHLLQAVIETARAQPDWEVLGLVRQADTITDLPANVTLLPWAPQRLVLKQADVAIIHAGVASVLECVEAGVPMLLYPQVNDQEGNAARVAFHGLGRIGQPADTADTIARHIRELSTSAEVAQRLAAMRASFEASTDDRTLEHAVEALARTGTLP
ncbi:MAG: nucleotide disphospho-sugar-binding domain-containing protein [Pseudomonadota bacterium]